MYSTTFGQRGHRFDDLVRQPVRIEIEQPDPFDALDRVQFAKQLGKGELLVEIESVLRDVLSDEIDFASASVGKVASLGEDALDRLALVRPAEAGDGAERTTVVAALGDLQVRAPRPARSGSGGNVCPAMVRRRDVQRLLAAGLDLFDDVRRTEPIWPTPTWESAPGASFMKLGPEALSRDNPQR